MGLTLSLLLWAGVLPEVSATARVKVLADTKRIVAYEGNAGRVKIFDLEQRHVGDVRLSQVPAYVCEAGGYIVFNTIDSDGVNNLVIVRPSLTGRKTTKGLSLYYPNTFRGKVLAYDYTNLAKQGSAYPLLAQEFDFTKLSYGPLKMFKLPAELSKSRMDIGPFWIFDRDGQVLIIGMNSPSIFVLDEAYQAKERVESTRVPGQPTKITIDLPGGFKNPGSFTLPRFMNTSEAKSLYVKWSREKTRIFLAWEDDEGVIYIAYGTAEEQKNHIAMLDGGFKVRSLGSFPGVIEAAKGHNIWWVERKPDGVEVLKTRF